MVLKPDHERVRVLLRDTVTLLCKNGLSFKKKFNIEAVIGVTLDDEDVFLVSINELIRQEVEPSSEAEASSQELSDTNKVSEERHRKKRKRSHTTKIPVEPPEEELSRQEENSPLVCDTNSQPNAHQPLPETVKMESCSDEESRDIVFVKQEMEGDLWPPEPQDTGLDYSAGDLDCSEDSSYFHSKYEDSQAGTSQSATFNTSSAETQLIKQHHQQDTDDVSDLRTSDTDPLPSSSSVESAPIVVVVTNGQGECEEHFLDMIPPTEKKLHPRKRCRVCYMFGLRRESLYHCAVCPRKPGLCKAPCFQAYHDQNMGALPKQPKLDNSMLP